MSTAYSYNPTLNPHSAMIPGVPLHDLTAQEYEQLSPWQRASVDTHPMYCLVASAPAEAGVDVEKHCNASLPNAAKNAKKKPANK